jgi:hypothetical protein
MRRLPPGAITMVLRLDDFTTGDAAIEVPSPALGQTTVRRHFQTGTMLGGGRFIVLHVGHAPSGLPARLTIGHGRLELALESGQPARIELHYGLKEDTSPSGLLVDLQGNRADRMRTRIAHAEPPVVNFNLQLKTAAGLFTAAENVGPGEVDFRFEDFTGPGGTDFTAVDALAFIFQVNGTVALAELGTAVRGSDLWSRSDAWIDAIGGWHEDHSAAQLTPRELVPIPADPGAPHHEHAETHLYGVVVDEVTFGADVTFTDGGEAHLQFRISGDGRYGVRLAADGIRVYRQVREPNWVFQVFDGGVSETPLAPGVPHRVLVVSRGSLHEVSVGTVRMRVVHDALPVGRLGLYAFRRINSAATFRFDRLILQSDVTARTNFALLYNTLGYCISGTKRALVRTLIDLPVAVDLERSSFSLTTTNDISMFVGSLRQSPRTYGMRLWEADFSAFDRPGTYVLHCNLAIAGVVHAFASSPFTIEERPLTRRMLRPLTVLNAISRNAADEELRRNWRPVSGTFTVADDGALWAHDANDQEGAVLERTRNGFLGPIPSHEQPPGYTMTGEITIERGCDAQLQFGIRPERRLAVTLQAGAGGHCAHGDGPGALRLHEEGSAVEGHFHTLVSAFLPQPFQAGRRYALRIQVREHLVTVFLDGLPRPQLEARTSVDLKGGFAIKAWGSTVRFSHVAVWRFGTTLEWVRGLDGEVVDRPVAPAGPCDGSTRESDSGPGVVRESFGCSPLFAQRAGFYDCNNVNGEATSHGAFLVGLVAVWRRRRSELSAADVATLTRSVTVAVAYLERLYRLGGGSGRYKHEDLGRAGGNDLDSDDRLVTYHTLAGVYGDLSFAAIAPDAAPHLAPGAMRRGWRGTLWLVSRGFAAHQRALLFALVFRCAQQDAAFKQLVQDTIPEPGVPALTYLQQQIIAAGDAFFTTELHFATLDGWKKAWRDTGQMIPWFEGIYYARQLFPRETEHWRAHLDRLTSELVNDLTSRNAFQVVPQASGGTLANNVNEVNWNDMASVPAVVLSGILPGRHFYNCTFFSTMALDMVFLGLMTGRRDLRRLAIGHLNWVLGLNPGVPVHKARNPSPSGTGWKATAFVHGLDAPYSRGFEHIDAPTSLQKPWLWGDEGEHFPKQVWRFQPLDTWNGFMSIVNGHVLWEGNWDYYNVGTDGWVSAETFMLNDGIYVRAAIAYEDWISGVFDGWVPLNDGGFLSASAIQNQDGRLEIVAPKADGTLVHTWEMSIGGSLSGWHAMDGFVEQPFGLLNFDGRMELLGRGQDGALWHRWQIAPNGHFAAWHSLGGAVLSAVAAHNADGRIEIFAAFADGSIQHRWQREVSGAFDAWVPLGAGHSPVVGTNADGRMEVFVVGHDRQVHHRWQVGPNQHFDAWHLLGGDVRQLTIARNQDGRLELFAITADHQIVHRWQVAPNQQFDAWHSLGGQYTAVQSVQLGDGRIELFAIGADHAVWRNVQTVPNGGFTGWECLGSRSSSLRAVTGRDGRVVLLARQWSGSIWFARQPAIGSWLRPA